MSGASTASDVGRLAEASLDNQFLPFTVGQHKLALGLTDVREIIPIPELVEIPNTSPVLSGLANLRGTVLPIVDLRAALGVEESADRDSSRVLVCGEERPVGLRADRVLPVAVVEPNQIDGMEIMGETEADESAVVDGLLRLGEAPDLFAILSVERLLRREFRPEDTKDVAKPKPQRFDTGGDTPAEDNLSNDRRFVGFTLGEEEFAVPIEEVQEVIRVPSAITALTTPREHILGIITLRNDLLPLVDLNALLNVAARHPIEDREIIVARIGSKQAPLIVGLMADRIREVLAVPEELIDSAADCVTKIDTSKLVEGVCRLDGGGRLIPLLAPKRLLELVQFNDLTPEDNADLTAEGAMTEQTDTTETALEVVVYQLDGQEYAVPITAVQEIIGIPEKMTRLPKAPSYVEGVINLRGTVLPVINMRAKLSLPDGNSDQSRQILVLSVDGLPTGFVVDMVSEVMRAPREAVRPALDVEGAASAMVKEVLSLEDSGRMIMLLSPETLLSRDHDEPEGEDATAELAGAAG